VAGVWESSGNHYGSLQADGTFRTNVPIFVPACCLDCRHYDMGEVGDYGSKLGPPCCDLNLFFPTRKGTCKRREP
jgi:hypothetical protein